MAAHERRTLVVADPVAAAIRAQLAVEATPVVVAAPAPAAYWQQQQQQVRGVAAGGLLGQLQQRAAEDSAPASRAQRAKDERAKAAAAQQEEGEKARCHLHKKPKEGCKRCQKYKEFLAKGQQDRDQDREALKQRMVSELPKIKPNAYEELDSRAPLELGNSKTFNFPPLLQSHIVESTHFKMMLEMPDVGQIVDEIYQFADGVEPYMQSTNTTPSALFCCVYRFLTMGLGAVHLRSLLEHEEAPYVRVAGFLFVRFGLPHDRLWHWLGEYVMDEEAFQPSKGSEERMTIGQYIEALLTQERVCNTVLPRLPVTTKRALDLQLAQVPQCRKRLEANKRFLDIYEKKGVRVEALFEDSWRVGETVFLNEASRSRPKLRIKLLDENGESSGEAVVSLGRVILTDARFSADQLGEPPKRREGRRRSRSRSPHVDWVREKGKSSQELVEEYKRRQQDRAVCTGGKKDYARRPVSFQVALPMEQGSASHQLAQDETAVQSRRGAGYARDRSRSPELARSAQSAEHQDRMRRLFEKYGMAKGATAEEHKWHGIEGPDVLRLG